MEYISNLTLSHFRSHKISKLSLDGRPVVVFGKNGTGKTNILEAVSLFSPGRGLRRATANDITRDPEAIGWKIEGRVKNRISEYEISISSENGESRRLSLDGKKASIMRLGQILRIVWLVPSMDRLWIEGSSGRRQFLDRLTLSYFPDHAEISLSYEKAMRERNRLLKEKVYNDNWYNADGLQISDPSLLAEAAGGKISEKYADEKHRLAACQQSPQQEPKAPANLTNDNSSSRPVCAPPFYKISMRHAHRRHQKI